MILLLSWNIRQQLQQLVELLVELLLVAFALDQMQVQLHRPDPRRHHSLLFIKRTSGSTSVPLWRDPLELQLRRRWADGSEVWLKTACRKRLRLSMRFFDPFFLSDRFERVDNHRRCRSKNQTQPGVAARLGHKTTLFFDRNKGPFKIRAARVVVGAILRGN